MTAQAWSGAITIASAAMSETAMTDAILLRIASPP
jgi:hypothetical protein